MVYSTHMTEETLSAKAQKFAAEAHKDQVETDALKTPYIVHLGEVAELTKQAGGSDEEVAAAWLHDAIEDTPTTIEEVRQEFGEEVARLVAALTDPPDDKRLPLPERKTKQAAHIEKEDASVRLIKLADQTSNVRLVGRGVLPDFDAETSINYIEGAKKIAEHCRGISALLDNLFEEACKVGFERFSSK